MELREVMQKRKSIRQYLTTPVEEEKVKAMIEAAILAPTWKNAQEIRYYVAVSEEKRQAVLDALAEGNRKKTQNAPVFLISAVILNRAGFQKDGTADNELGNGWGYYDLGLQNENLILKAKELGLDTLIMGIRNAEKIHEMLQIPETEQVVAVIAVGYRDIDPEKPKRKTPEDILTFLEG